MPAGELPQQLIDALLRARRLERVAVGVDHQRRAVAVTSALMLAATHDGWQVKLIADALGINRITAQERIQSARDRYGDVRPAVSFLPPGVDLGDWTPRRGRRSKLPETASRSTNEWPSLTEASEYFDTSRRTVRTAGIVMGCCPTSVRWRKGIASTCAPTSTVSGTHRAAVRSRSTGALLGQIRAAPA